MPPTIFNIQTNQRLSTEGDPNPITCPSANLDNTGSKLLVVVNPDGIKYNSKKHYRTNLETINFK